MFVFIKVLNIFQQSLLDCIIIERGTGIWRDIMYGSALGMIIIFQKKLNSLTDCNTSKKRIMCCKKR